MGTHKESFRPHLEKLCETCKNRFDKNVLRIFDCKEDSCKSIAQNVEAESALCSDCAEHFEKVKIQNHQCLFTFFYCFEFQLQSFLVCLIFLHKKYLLSQYKTLQTPIRQRHQSVQIFIMTKGLMRKKLMKIYSYK